ncbi:MAG: C45 family peptidase [Armatimonadetes bacterium]|nr:C45 family peptidase [Armatimonadota bacterium]
MAAEKALFAKAYGDHYEVGRQIGAAFRSVIAELVAGAGIPGKYEGPAYDERLALMRANFERLAPELLAEMEGLADGAGLPREHVLKFNVLPEIKRAGCSLIGFADAPGGPVLAKTTDIPAGRTDRRAMGVVDVPGKIQALMLTVPGTVWCSGGVNEFGLGCANAAVEPSEWRDDGIPSRCIPRLLLQRCRSFDEALDFLRAVRFNCAPFNLLVADEERVVCVERSVYKMAIREPADGVVFATNHYVTSELAELHSHPETEMRNSQQRYEKLTRLVGEKPHTLEGARAILEDCTKPGPICQTGDDPSRLVTTAASIFRPRARVAWFTPGMPCQSRLRPFQLQLPVVAGGSRVVGEYG